MIRSTFSVMWVLCWAGISCAHSPAPCGADVPFTTFEAETATTTGQVVRMAAPPGPDFAAPEIEASGRSFVRLEQPGQYCEFVAAAPGNALVIRHSLPDDANGGGRIAALCLYINGQLAQRLEFNSRYNWLYGEPSSPHGGQSNDPKSGRAHVFWNDERFRLTEHGWQAGDAIRLEWNGDDDAGYCCLDLVDFEQVLSALSPPQDQGYLSVTEFGATADDHTDDSQAIGDCIAAARDSGKVVWLPAGTYHHDRTFAVPGVQVEGAGMWHTRLVGTGPQLGFVLSGDGPRVANLSIESTSHFSRSDAGGMALRARGARKWSVEKVWITHTHGGMWLNGMSHGFVRGCRVYCTYADAINLNRGSHDNVVEHNFVRGAGDDGIATLAERKDAVPSRNNVIRRNTVIANWWGHNIDVAGGSGHVVESNYLADNSHSGCFTFNHPEAYPMHELTDVAIRGNTIVRGGGNHAGQRRGAIWSFAGDSPIRGARFEANQIVDPIFRAIHLHGHARQELTFVGNSIAGSGMDVVRIDESVSGGLEFRENSIRNSPRGGKLIDNAAGEEFRVTTSSNLAD